MYVQARKQGVGRWEGSSGLEYGGRLGVGHLAVLEAQCQMAVEMLCIDMTVMTTMIIFIIMVAWQLSENNSDSNDHNRDSHDNTGKHSQVNSHSL